MLDVFHEQYSPALQGDTVTPMAVDWQKIAVLFWQQPTVP
jgi:hypothetical protein